MKGKRYLARADLLPMIYLLLPFIYLLFFLFVIIFVPEDFGSIEMWQTFAKLVALSLITYTPYGLIFASGTITLYEDKLCYKKNIFSKKKWLHYSEITQVYIDFCNYPVGISGRRIIKSIYIESDRTTECQINITHKLIDEFCKRIDKSKIHVNFKSLLYFRKKYREQLYDYLTMWQKIELEQKLGKKHKR